MILRGHMYWVSLDKRRPALVVSPDYRNERASDVIVVPATSRLRASPTRVLLSKGEAGIPRASALNAEQIATLAVVEIGEEIGALSEVRMGDVERAILRAIGIAI